MQAQLNEERFRYQNLLTEHLKLEERYADLRSEKEAAVVRKICRATYTNMRSRW